MAVATNYQKPQQYQTAATNNLVMPQGQPQPAAQGAPQPMGQYGGINPQATGMTDPNFNKIGPPPIGGRGGQYGQYGGINPGANQSTGGMSYVGGGFMGNPNYYSGGGQRQGSQQQLDGLPYQQAGGPQPTPNLPGPQNPGPQQPTPQPQQNYTVDQYQQWAQQRYGRQATPQELQQLASRVGYQGGPINQQQWEKAQAESDNMARSLGWNGPAQPATPPWGQNASQIDPVTGRMFGPQYQNPYQQQQQQLMQQILGSGGSMNQQVQDQMFEQQKEQANSLAKQFGLQGAQAAGARGFSGGGYAAQSAQAQTQSNLGRELMSGRRDISTRAAQVNRQDQLNALQQSMGLDQQGYGQFMGDRNASLQEWLAQRGNQLDTRRQGAQEEQFRRQMELEYQRFVESQRQFNQSFGENQRQYNGQMGFNYTNMNNNNNNAFMQYLMGR